MQDIAIVTMDDEQETVSNFQMLPLSMIFSDLYPTFQGHNSIQRQITRLPLSVIYPMVPFPVTLSNT